MESIYIFAVLICLVPIIFLDFTFVWIFFRVKFFDFQIFSKSIQFIGKPKKNLRFEINPKFLEMNFPVYVFTNF